MRHAGSSQPQPSIRLPAALGAGLRAGVSVPGPLAQALSSPLLLSNAPALNLQFHSLTCLSFNCFSHFRKCPQTPDTPPILFKKKKFPSSGEKNLKNSWKLENGSPDLTRRLLVLREFCGALIPSQTVGRQATQISSQPSTSRWTASRTLTKQVT